VAVSTAAAGVGARAAVGVADDAEAARDAAAMAAVAAVRGAKKPTDGGSDSDAGGEKTDRHKTDRLRKRGGDYGRAPFSVAARF
jgi:hypothetical protein